MSASRLITCSEAVQQMWDYLDRALDPKDLARVEQHLSFCRKCCGELEFAKEVQVVLASQAGDEIPPPVRERLERYLGGLS